MADLDRLDEGADGTLYIRFRKADGGWHRTSIPPGVDPDVMLDHVDAHLKRSLGDAIGVRAASRVSIKDRISRAPSAKRPA